VFFRNTAAPCAGGGLPIFGVRPMIAIAKPSVAGSTTASANTKASWRNRFADMLPTIRRNVRFAFRHLDVESRAEAAQEAIAFAFMAYTRLVQLDKTHLAYPSVLAKFAVARVRSGRSVGRRMNVDDVTSRWCQCRREVCVESLDRRDGRGGWREVLLTDHRSSPADLAAARIDIACWLGKLTPRTRRIARDLAMGYSTGEVARRHGLSSGRISQVRNNLHEDWCRFQGEVAKKAAGLPASAGR
jgi:hypothetical protein